MYSEEPATAATTITKTATVATAAAATITKTTATVATTTTAGGLLNSLPNSLCLCVVSFLPLRDVLLAVALLSRKWNRLVRDDADADAENRPFWKEVCLREMS